MTAYDFSESASLAMTFAVKLLSGTLNVIDDYESGVGEFANKTYEFLWFSTNIMDDVRHMLQKYELSRLELTDIFRSTANGGLDREERHVTVYARDPEGHGERIAMFEVSRMYLDGDSVQGWTRWSIKSVSVLLWKDWIKLSSQPLDRQGDMIVWGQIKKPTA